MNELEKYLNDATKGLWGKRKKAVSLELRGAIEDKQHRYRVAGLGEREALERAIADLGNARAVRVGFFRLHSAPLLGQLGALVLASSAAVLALWPSSAAQVAATQAQLPITCVEQGSMQTINSSTPDMHRMWEMWLKRPDGSFDLERGIRACQTIEMNNSYLDLNQLAAAWDAAGISIEQQWNQFTVYFKEGAGKETLTGDLQKGGRIYVNLRTVVDTLNASGLSVRVSGDVNPIIEVGSHRFQIGTPATPVLSDNLYSALISAAHTNRTISSELFADANPKHQVLAFSSVTDEAARALNFAPLKVSVRDGSVVLFVYQSGVTTRFYQVTRVKEGRVRVFLTQPYIEKWSAASSLTDLSAGTFERPQWLLLDLSKTTDWRKPKYEIIPPSSIKVE